MTTRERPRPEAEALTRSVLRKIETLEARLDATLKTLARMDDEDRIRRIAREEAKRNR